MDGADHDLLVQIHTKMERALVDIKELKDDTGRRVSTIEDDMSGMGRRITTLENWRWYVIGITVAAVFIGGYILNYLKK
jgi:hypothetical protein